MKINRDFQVPNDLKTGPGTRKDPGEEAYFAWAFPEPEFWDTRPGEAHLKLASYMNPSFKRVEERFDQPVTQRLREVLRYHNLPPLADPGGQDITEDLRKEAARLSIDVLGVTKFHRRYVYAAYKRRVRFKNLIVIGLEQDHQATNEKTPSEELHYLTYETILEATRMGLALAEFIRGKGYKVQFVAGVIGLDMVKILPYAEEAGLGQMGANGQLLSPYFGSRWRPIALSTDAPLQHDKARDFGIGGLCDKCQVCVRRCPGRAIPKRRVHHRGVFKYKIVPERCLPMMEQYDLCGVCIKVCPVQKYGLQAVFDHYRETGRVLGKGTDELEGYPLENRGYFPVGEMPQFTRDEARMRYELLETLPPDIEPWPKYGN